MNDEHTPNEQTTPTDISTPAPAILAAPIESILTPQAAPTPAAAVSAQPNSKGGTIRLRTLVAVALICSLLGGIIGGGAVAYLMPHNNSNNAPIIEVNGSTSLISAIAEANMPTVVSIVNSQTTTYSSFFGNFVQQSTASGSGVIISGEGYIITNYHVIENAYHLAVTLYDGRTYEAEIIGGDEAYDLAVLKIDADNLTVANLGDSDALRIGETVVAIGNPLDAQAFAWTVTDGIVSGLARSVETDSQGFKLIQTNAAINAGNSGGALLNSRGELIGINSMKIGGSSVEGMGFAIPINEAKDVIEQLIAQGYVSRPFLGISGYDITASLLAQVSLKRDSGILITQLTAGAPAESAGIKVGDIIFAVDGTEITSFEDLSEILAAHKVGETLNLSINRDGSEISLNITVGEQGSKMTLKPTPTANSSSNNIFRLQ